MEEFDNVEPCTSVYSLQTPTLFTLCGQGTAGLPSDFLRLPTYSHSALMRSVTKKNDRV